MYVHTRVSVVAAVCQGLQRLKLNPEFFPIKINSPIIVCARFGSHVARQSQGCRMTYFKTGKILEGLSI
jgi:hypothetical protein